MPDFDLILRNGTILDGSGDASYVGDLAIAADRIAAIGKVAASAKTEIDVSRLAIAPGFIDVHTHDDAAVVRDPAVDFKIMQGVTTDVIGNCGAGVAPTTDAFRQFYARGIGPILGDSALTWTTTSEYFDAVDAAHPSLNVTAYVPHGVLRYIAMGLERREPEERELALMCELLDEGMRAGAIGMSSGLIYPPGSFSRTPELIELARVVAKYGGIYTSHIRDEGPGLLRAVEEAIRIGEEAGCGVEISHHKAAGREAWGATERSLAVIADARARGLDVTVDVYPYTAGSTALAAIARFGDDVFEMPALIASVKYNKDAYEGKYVSDIAAALGMSNGDAVRKLLLDEENSPTVINFTMDEPDVRRVLADQHAMIGSDGIPSEGKPHPRLYGTMARVLGTYVRDTGLLTVEDAVRKMTSLPSAKHRVKERGLLREGWFADVVVFDPAKIDDIATYEEPRQYPKGIEYVVVNGKLAVDGGHQTDARAGRMLRRNK
jgi:N-acyl-D-aspartate/D-glutamate deacylase